MAKEMDEAAALEKAAEKTRKEEELKYEKLLKSMGAVTGSQYYEHIKDLPVLSFGVFAVDVATGKIDPEHGNGGLRARDIAEVCGKPGQGKTALVEAMIKTTQQRYPHHGSVVGIFSEPPDILRMRRIGIDTDKIIIIEPFHKDSIRKKSTAENQLSAMLELSGWEKTKLCIIDSVATLVTASQDIKELDEAMPVAGLAIKFNQFIVDFGRSTKVAPLLLINHYSEAIKAGKPSFVAPSELIVDSPGGRYFKHLTMLRMIASASPAWLQEGAEKTKHSKTGARMQHGLNITYNMFRNKYSNKDGFRQCKATIDFESAKFNNEEVTLSYANHFVRAGEKPGELYSLLDPPVIQRGAWFSIGDERFQGMDKAVEYLEQNPDILAKIQAQILPLSERFFADDTHFSIDEVMGT